jgi:hypothetical protein
LERRKENTRKGDFFHFSKFKWKRVQVNDTEGGPMGKWKRE